MPLAFLWIWIIRALTFDAQIIINKLAADILAVAGTCKAAKVFFSRSDSAGGISFAAAGSAILADLRQGQRGHTVGLPSFFYRIGGYLMDDGIGHANTNTGAAGAMCATYTAKYFFTAGDSLLDGSAVLLTCAVAVSRDQNSRHNAVIFRPVHMQPRQSKNT